VTAESASIVAIIIGAIAVLASATYALLRMLSLRTRFDRISNAPGVVAAAGLPARVERISTGVQRLQESGTKWDALLESVTATRDAGFRLQSGIDSVAACMIDLLDTFVPSMRGSVT